MTSEEHQQSVGDQLARQPASSSPNSVTPARKTLYSPLAPVRRFHTVDADSSRATLCHEELDEKQLAGLGDEDYVFVAAGAVFEGGRVASWEFDQY